MAKAAPGTDTMKTNQDLRIKDLKCLKNVLVCCCRNRLKKTRFLLDGALFRFQYGLSVCQFIQLIVFFHLDVEPVHDENIDKHICNHKI